MATTIKPFAPPDRDFVRVHNCLFDHIMPNLKPNAWKVLCFILRKTNGWNRPTERLSYVQLREGTGIGSDATLSAAIKELFDAHFLIITPTQWQSNEYALNRAFEITVDDIYLLPTTVSVELPTTETVVATETVELPTTVSVELPTTETVDTKRQNNKYTKKRNTATQSAHKAQRQNSVDETSSTTKVILDAYIEVRGKNGINYGKEGKAAKRIAAEGGTPELVKGCYSWMKQDKFWQHKPLGLSVIHEHLPEYQGYLERTAATAKTKIVNGRETLPDGFKVVSMYGPESET